MTQTLEAVYEDGVFKPLSEPKGVANHSRVTLSVTTPLETAKPWELAGSMSSVDTQNRQLIDS